MLSPTFSELRRPQPRTLGGQDDLVDTCAAFLAMADPAHEASETFVARLRDRVQKSLCVDQRCAWVRLTEKFGSYLRSVSAPSAESSGLGDACRTLAYSPPVTSFAR